MPRISTSASDPLDFCTQCMPSERIARRDFGDIGDGPDGRGNCFDHGTEHPDYGGEEYTCEKCHAILTDDDN
jgi:hypothetical protein